MARLRGDGWRAENFAPSDQRRVVSMEGLPGAFELDRDLLEGKERSTFLILALLQQACRRNHFARH